MNVDIYVDDKGLKIAMLKLQIRLLIIRLGEGGLLKKKSQKILLEVKDLFLII